MDAELDHERVRQSAISLYLEDTSRSAADVGRLINQRQQTVWGWLKRAGVLRAPRTQQIADEAMEMYLAGKTYQEVADYFSVSRAIICRIADDRGIAGCGGREVRKNSGRIKARALYSEGQTYAEIARTLKLSPATVARWTGDIEGGSLVAERKDREVALQAYAQKATIEAIAATLGRSVNTVSGWLHASGVRVLSGIDRMSQEQVAQYSAKGVATRAEMTPPPTKRLCEYCGEDFQLPSGRRKSRQIYCSKKCAGLGRRSPELRRVFPCEVCGKETERFVSTEISSRARYCSRECFYKRNITVDKYVDWKGNVMDSSWEAMFLGLCGISSIQCERFDRAHGVEWEGGKWYAPDFWLPVLKVAVEVKGRERGHDRTKWEAFNQKLIVVGREELDMLRKADNVARAIQSLVQSGDGA